MSRDGPPESGARCTFGPATHDAPSPRRRPAFGTTTQRDPDGRRLSPAEILDGRLRPGEHIRQQDVAAANDTSRVPVREALRILESEGLVHLVQHSGARVSGLDYAEFSELYRIREAIEPMLLRRASRC